MLNNKKKNEDKGQITHGDFNAGAWGAEDPVGWSSAGLGHLPQLSSLSQVASLSQLALSALCIMIIFYVSHWHRVLQSTFVNMASTESTQASPEVDLLFCLWG